MKRRAPLRVLLARAAVLLSAAVLVIPLLVVGALTMLIGAVLVMAANMVATPVNALDDRIAGKRKPEPPPAAVVPLRQRGLREWARYAPNDTPDDAA